MTPEEIIAKFRSDDYDAIAGEELVIDGMSKSVLLEAADRIEELQATITALNNGLNLGHRIIEDFMSRLSTCNLTITRLSVPESTYTEKMALMRGIHKCQDHHMPKDRVQPCCLGSGIALFIQERKNAG